MLVLDARPVPGGGAATEELLGPGYLHRLVLDRRTRSSRRIRCCATTSSGCSATTGSSTSSPTRSRTSRSRTASSSRCGSTSSARARRSPASRARDADAYRRLLADVRRGRRGSSAREPRSRRRASGRRSSEMLAEHRVGQRPRRAHERVGRDPRTSSRTGTSQAFMLWQAFRRSCRWTCRLRACSPTRSCSAASGAAGRSRAAARAR